MIQTLTERVYDTNSDASMIHTLMRLWSDVRAVGTRGSRLTHSDASMICQGRWNARE